MRISVAILLVALIDSTFACSVPPIDLFEDNYALVNKTEKIVLARAVSASPESNGSFVHVTFEVVRTLKGSVPELLVLAGYSIDDESIDNGDFNAHKDPKFWAFSYGNSIMPGDCQAYGRFRVGQTYLLFLREQSHVKGFENIRTDEDLWLQVVELLAKGE